MKTEREDAEMRLRRLTPQQVKNRQTILNRVRHFWVEGILEASLHNQVLRELGLKECVDPVVSSWNLKLEMVDEAQQPLAQGTNVISLFDQLSEGKILLILGKPGAGKTTTLLELTRDLVNRAEQGLDYRIPVVFNLSSWAIKKPAIADWLVQELNSQYSISKKIGKNWVKKQELLLLLDGLDEIKTEQRGRCVAALNDFQQNYASEMVICSRIKDYEELSNHLNLENVVYLKSLTLEQVSDYLDKIHADLTGLRALIAEDKALKELAKSPLMLNIMILAYQGVAVEDLPKTEIVEERRKQVFDAYIKRMFRRPTYFKVIPMGFFCITLHTPPALLTKAPVVQEGALREYVSNSNPSGIKQRYSEAQSIRWLAWLAQRMIEQSHSVFFIDGMHTWLQGKSKRILYGLGGGVLIGLSLALGMWLLYGLLINGLIGLIQGLPIGKLSYWLSYWLIQLLIYGLIGGLIYGLIEPIFSSNQVCIQYSLHLILYRNGYIPCYYWPFLDYASERIFLQKVGGGYLFIHRLLMEHFAQMELEPVQR